MTTSSALNNEQDNGASAAKVGMKFEVIVVPVAEVDRSKAFYTKLGWGLDETRINLILKQGYVWVFTNHEEVAFAFSESREASTPQEVLQEFRGVLVSDFYTGYDSITCSQQKCLVHLMRDINEDLCKQPFNEEIRVLKPSGHIRLTPVITIRR